MANDVLFIVQQRRRCGGARFVFLTAALTCKNEKMHDVCMMYVCPLLFCLAHHAHPMHWIYTQHKCGSVLLIITGNTRVITLKFLHLPVDFFGDPSKLTM